ncbi:hypothetical protein E9840_05940 [Tissierella creatinini]|nr:hypothetical protein E9840_05940 [Tissierella creatinini]TJX63552.1 hypothetical protein E8P77_14995 [Soehngenia saccharolytica]
MSQCPRRCVCLGRKIRVQYYGALYHVTHKGRRDIFLEDEDKLHLLGILSDVKDNFDFKLMAYCIMDNKYDLLIKTHNISISKVIQRVNMIYAKYFNDKYKRKGPVFGGRYESNIVISEDVLLNVIKYIHMIPLYERKVSSTYEYKWTSDFLYRTNIGSLVDIDYLLDILALERHDAIRIYESLMDKAVGEAEPIKWYYDKEKDILEHKKRNINLDDVLLKVCGNESDFQLIKNGSKKSHLMHYKEGYIKESSELGFKSIDIGQNIGISDRAVRKYLLRLRGN